MKRSMIIILAILIISLTSCIEKRDISAEIIKSFTDEGTVNIGYEFNGEKGFGRYINSDAKKFIYDFDGALNGVEKTYENGMITTKSGEISFTFAATKNDLIYNIDQLFTFLAEEKYDRTKASISCIDGYDKYIFTFNNNKDTVTLAVNIPLLTPYYIEARSGNNNIALYFK